MIENALLTIHKYDVIDKCNHLQIPPMIISVVMSIVIKNNSTFCLLNNVNSPVNDVAINRKAYIRQRHLV